MRPDGSRREEGSTSSGARNTRGFEYLLGGSGESRLFMWAASMVDVCFCVCFIYHFKLKEKEQEKTTILLAPVEVLSY